MSSIFSNTARPLKSQYSPNAQTSTYSSPALFSSNQDAFNIRFGSDESPGTPDWQHNWENPRVQRAARAAGYTEEQINEAHQAGLAAYERSLAAWGEDHAQGSYGVAQMNTLSGIDGSRLGAYANAYLEPPQDTDTE